MCTSERARLPQDQDDVETEPDDVGLEDDHYIQFDLNPHIQNFIVVDNVAEKNGKVVGLDPKPQAMLRMNLMELWGSKHPVIAVGSMHAFGGYRGLEFAAEWLRLDIPVLLLDVRLRQERPPLSFSVKPPASEVEATLLHQKLRAHYPDIVSAIDAKASLSRQLTILEKCALTVFEVMRRSDESYSQRLMTMGLADIYEVCRVAFFHAALLQCAEEKVQWMTLYERIVDEEKAMQSTGTADLATKFRDTLLHKVSDWCTQAEFKAYWELKSQHEKAEIFQKDGIGDFREFFNKEMNAARTAYHAILSARMLFSAHVKDLEQLRFVVNNKMMSKDALPRKNTIEVILQ